MNDQRRLAEVLLFWFGAPAERGKADRRWFVKSDAFDREVRERFLALYQDAAAGELVGVREDPSECLALILLLDQFPRNMFRGTPRAFATDALALETARHALARGFDRGMPAVERLFVYLPFEHSESIADQERACELMKPLDALQPQLEAYRYAVLHRDIIRRFGRFPHRNAILGRDSTPEELEFLQGPGSSF
jgi:uncharacterized protein (DUF924 family)